MGWSECNDCKLIRMTVLDADGTRIKHQNPFLTNSCTDKVWAKEKDFNKSMSMTTIGTNGTNNGNNNDNDESSLKTLNFKFILTKGHVHAHILTVTNVSVKCIHLCLNNPKRDRQKPTINMDTFWLLPMWEWKAFICVSTIQKETERNQPSTQNKSQNCHLTWETNKLIKIWQSQTRLNDHVQSQCINDSDKENVPKH